MHWCKRSLIVFALFVAALAPMAASAQEPAVLTLIHGVPGTTVDVCLGPSPGGPFAKIGIGVTYKGTITVEPTMGTYTLALVAPGGDCATGAIAGLSIDVTLLPSINVSVVAGLTGDGSGLTMTQFTNDVTPLNFGRELEVRHVAAAPALDFRYGLIFPRSRIGNLQFGTGSAESVFGGLLRTEVRLASTTTRVQGPNLLQLSSRESTIVYILGKLADQTIDVAIQRIDRSDGVGFDIEAGFTPAQPTPGANSVAMAQALAFGPFLAVDVNVTDTMGIYGAKFDVTYDPAKLIFLTSGPGALLEQGMVPVTYDFTLNQNGRVTLEATRVGPVGEINATGTISLVRLIFLTLQAGTSNVVFDNQNLLDEGGVPLAGLTWFGGMAQAN